MGKPTHSDPTVKRGLRDGAFLADATIFDQPGQRARVTIAEGQRIVIVTRGGDRADVLPAQAAGTYEVSSDILPGGAWPIVLFTVAAAHVEAWLRLAPDALDRVLTRCEAEIAKARGRMQ